jgi:predicted membrane-bound dolichyl-phosphate-mannose-protein mannosyltransferase
MIFSRFTGCKYKTKNSIQQQWLLNFSDLGNSIDSQGVLRSGVPFFWKAPSAVFLVAIFVCVFLLQDCQFFVFIQVICRLVVGNQLFK